MIGERRIYYLLCKLDPEFDELFEVAADFEDDIERDDSNARKFAEVIAALARKNELRPLDRTGVARVIEHASRLADDSEKITARVGTIEYLLREADYVAGKDGQATIRGEDVRTAIEARHRRADRIRERGLEMIHRGVILIDTDGTKVGQINGLSVMSLGSHFFGRPTRITARVRMGRGEVVDIEREVELGGPTHSKGVLILASYLGTRYALDKPLSLSASLVFEQSYGGVDGDSASSTELYAILSALAEIPLKQSFAVTGSVNQHGEVQAIGSVNEKIEGFFDACKGRGLTGDQGVLIPAANVKNLMLRDDVVEAARTGMFAIYPVETIDQGIEILTGVTAGERGAEGTFAAGSINRAVEERLAALAEARRRFGATGRDQGNAGSGS